jgi:hypothetical protein
MTQFLTIGVSKNHYSTSTFLQRPHIIRDYAAALTIAVKRWFLGPLILSLTPKRFLFFKTTWLQLCQHYCHANIPASGLFSPDGRNSGGL